jgi:60 kDa SS-A/Ro ribonucleoprotein
MAFASFSQALTSNLPPVESAVTPVVDEIAQSKEVTNDAGGVAFAMDDVARLRRFLILGADSNTLYMTQKEMVLDNAKVALRMVANGQGEVVLQEIENISLAGRAPKQDATMFALAIVARAKDRVLAKKAYAIVSKVCRIPTHLFMFVGFTEAIDSATGWGRVQRKVISDWYTEKDARSLAFAVTKYKQREGWSHRDILRLAHPKTRSHLHQVVFRYVTHGMTGLEELLETLSPLEVEECNAVIVFLQAVEQCRAATEVTADILSLITEHNLAREHMSTGLLASPEVWQTLLPSMPLTATMRSLNKLTMLGLLADDAHRALVVQRLTGVEGLRKARMHPLSALQAKVTYESGQGAKGSLTWEPHSEVTAALEDMFYKSFDLVEPTGKRYFLAMDVSGSMTCGTCGGSLLTPRQASVAMMMTTLRTESNCYVAAFTGKLTPLNHEVRAAMTLEETMRAVSNLPFGPTDCAQPMLYALEHGLDVDVFVVYTDCETWAGDVTPAEALRTYRESSGIADAKLIVCGMTSAGFTLADPDDAGMLDVVGFDTATPAIMADFVLGQL